MTLLSEINNNADAQHNNKANIILKNHDNIKVNSGNLSNEYEASDIKNSSRQLMAIITIDIILVIAACII